MSAPQAQHTWPVGANPDLRAECGPFDIIGDVHGCAEELEALLSMLGYRVYGGRVVASPPGRRAIFVGDLVDRGPRSPDVLRLVMGMVEGGAGFCVPGNHDVKLVRWLEGKQVTPTHGTDRTIAQFTADDPSLKARVHAFLTGLPTYLWLAGGALAVAHAGIKEDMLGQTGGSVRKFCLYGETSGEHDEFGLPVRYHWAAEYRGATRVVYGHTPVPEPAWVNNTLCIDTGCCFGGRLSALRWPELDVVSVPAGKVYSDPVRPFGHPPVRPGAVV